MDWWGYITNLWMKETRKLESIIWIFIKIFTNLHLRCLFTDNFNWGKPSSFARMNLYSNSIHLAGNVCLAPIWGDWITPSKQRLFPNDLGIRFEIIWDQNKINRQRVSRINREKNKWEVGHYTESKAAIEIYGSTIMEKNQRPTYLDSIFRLGDQWGRLLELLPFGPPNWRCIWCLEHYGKYPECIS